MIKRPSQAIFTKLFSARTPVRLFHSTLRVNHHTLRYAKRRVRALILRHLDVFKLYADQPQARLDFLKREVLLDPELSFLMQYEDGWAVDVLVRLVYHQRLRLVQQKLNSIRSQQHNYRQRLFTSHPRVSPELRIGVRCTRSKLKNDAEVATTSSAVALLATHLDSVTPSLLRFQPAIVKAGLCTDEHLHQLFRMLPTSRDNFILQALGTEKSTLFERVLVMDILEQMSKEKW